MKAQGLREQSVDELRQRQDDLAEEGFNLRFQNALGQLSSPIRLREARRDLARVRTVLREHELGIRELPGGTDESGAGENK